MQKFLEGDEAILSILREQFEVIDVAKREFTGAGFYTTFTVVQGLPRLLGTRSLDIGDVVADITGLNNGAGFLLSVREGLLHKLEGFSYGGESWPEITSFEIGYLAGNKMAKQRDMEALRKELAGMHAG